ncbi:Ig-like domain-containing protein [Planococcus sp. 107-1]|uniref:Ig-like domain-containing protein n=1 Tax=Planococcus sp. 107-1 TaxID=2908840 RepID=UPI001F1D933A|nr:Ig-like domain-containing protein [Planococcus sp. 107-1]UJF26131.1 Ig-like domain-containing protein [Planococcus sp. 107-1]
MFKGQWMKILVLLLFMVSIPFVQFAKAEGEAILPQKIEVNKSSLQITSKQTVILSAVVAPADSMDKTVLWKSSNPKVASVDAKGAVKALKNGTATVTASAKGNPKVEKKIEVKVSDKIVKLDKTSLTIVKGQTASIKATVSPIDSTDKGVTWKTSNYKIATVDKNGKVAAKATGTVNITATVKGAKVATAKVTVKAPVLATSVKVSKTSATLAKGKTLNLTATVSPSSTTNKNVNWRTSNAKVAKVDSKGKVTAVGSGTAKITVTTSNGKTAITTITVPNVKTLSAGNWKAGKDLTPGRYKITTTSGSGNLIIAENDYDRFINEILSSEDDGFGVTAVTTDIKSGDSIKIMGLNNVTFTQVFNVKTNILHAGYWTVGKDIAAGNYRITTPKGSGNLIMYRGDYLLVNEILANKPDYYEVSSVTTTLKNNDRIYIGGLNKVVFTKK